MNTGIFFPADLCSSLDAYIVFFCFEAVVLTARYAKFEFMWKFTSEISFILFNSYIITVDIPTRTDCISLTCCHCPNSRSADTRFAAACGKVCCYINSYDIAVKLNDRYFGRELPHKFKFGVTGCQNNCLKAEENDVGIKGAAQISWKEGSCIHCGVCHTEKLFF